MHTFLRPDGQIIRSDNLEKFLGDIGRDKLVVYGESSHIVKEVDLGGGDRLEIHYYEDGDEINEAFFFSVSGGPRIALSREEIESLSNRF